MTQGGNQGAPTNILFFKQSYVRTRSVALKETLDEATSPTLAHRVARRRISAVFARVPVSGGPCKEGKRALFRRRPCACPDEDVHHELRGQNLRVYEFAGCALRCFAVRTRMRTAVKSVAPVTFMSNRINSATRQQSVVLSVGCAVHIEEVVRHTRRFTHQQTLRYGPGSYYTLEVI